MAHQIHKNLLLKQKAQAASRSLKWIVNQIPDDLGETNEEKMLKAIREYCNRGANVIDETSEHIILEPKSYIGKHCSDCQNYEHCKNERRDPDAIKNVEITDRNSHCFKPIDFWQHCKFLVDYIGKPYYRICPKCNDDHNGTCKNCAWSSCLTCEGCRVFGFWNDGQYCGERNHVVMKILTWNEIPTIVEEYGHFVFLDREDAELALQALRADNPKDIRR